VKEKTVPQQATAIAHPNIAFIKYWGNWDDDLRLPVNGSLSMNLASLSTRTTVQFDPNLEHDKFKLNDQDIRGEGLARVNRFLDLVRELAGITTKAIVASVNDFPTGAGIASSASAFAALALASTSAAGLELSESNLSRLARRGSGSACRSIPAGFVEWEAGTSDVFSFANSFAPPEYWDLSDCIAVVHPGKKITGSSEGHRLAATSPVQSARVEDTPRRLKICREAILARDFEELAEIIELDSNLLHAVMMTSNPPLYYWLGATIEVMREVLSMRRSGTPCAFTIDAGPNVHVICPSTEAEQIQYRLKIIPGVDTILSSPVGGGTRLVED
jgi:diphosphomevalonate decarboxylase